MQTQVLNLVSYKSCFVGTMENSKQIKSLKCHLELNFKNFQERNMEKIYVYCNDILTIGIDIIGIDVNIINKLIFTIILYLFLLHIFLEGEY